MLKRGILKSFNSQDYTAAVQLTGSDRVYLENIRVARNISAQEMIAGREVAMLSFNESNVREAVVIAVYPAV